MCDVLRDLLHLYNLKNLKNTHGGVLLSKSNTLPSLFFTFFKLYKWYQIAQRITYNNSTNIAVSNATLKEKQNNQRNTASTTITITNKIV